jgi:16S rRNA processing protein RimM
MSSFGVSGVLKVRPSCGDGSHFCALSEMMLGFDAPEKLYSVESAEQAQGLVHVKFAGIDSPEAARALSGLNVFVPREFAAVLKPNEHYIEDLKGLSVVTESGESAGTLCDIIEGGGGFLAEVLCAGDSQKRLAPWRAEFFGEVNQQGGTVILLQPWILDDGETP